MSAKPTRSVNPRVNANIVGRLYRALLFVWAALTLVLSPMVAVAQQPPPNILVIMGDDIGYWNISAYNRGQMGYRTSI